MRVVRIACLLFPDRQDAPDRAPALRYTNAVAVTLAKKKAKGSPPRVQAPRVPMGALVRMLLFGSISVAAAAYGVYRYYTVPYVPMLVPAPSASTSASATDSEIEVEPPPSPAPSSSR